MKHMTSWKELNEQKDYSPFDHGTLTKEENDSFFLTDEEKKERWDMFQDTELDSLIGAEIF